VVMMASNLTGQLAEDALSAPPVIRSVDPGHDGEAEVVAGGPAAAVEHDPLRQREERFHRGVLASGADAAHGSDEAVLVEFGLETPRTKRAPLGAGSSPDYGSR